MIEGGRWYRRERERWYDRGREREKEIKEAKIVMIPFIVHSTEELVVPEVAGILQWPLTLKLKLIKN